MKTLLYAITSPSDAAPGTPGLRGGGLTTAIVGNLQTWTSELPDDAEPFTREDLLEHHRIVADIHARVDACLPARFPTWLADAQVIAARRDALARQLEHVRGRAEVAVTAAWTTSDDAPPSDDAAMPPGHAYLRTRQRVAATSDDRRGLARDLEARILAAIGTTVTKHQSRICPSAAVALSLALLVPRTSAEMVLQQVPRMAPDVRILVNGPWPPYSFASITSD